ncbi:aminotransferase class V-fold PLP-dependent enzyme, partial [Marinimicrobium sp. UBA4209]
MTLSAPRQPIYLDYAATTPVDPAVAEQMAACLTREGNFANPASRSHLYGWQAEEAVENARQQVA